MKEKNEALAKIKKGEKEKEKDSLKIGEKWKNLWISQKISG